RWHVERTNRCFYKVWRKSRAIVREVIWEIRVKSGSTNSVGIIGGSLFISPSGGNNAVVQSSGLPSASDVTNSLFLNPNVSAAYNAPGSTQTAIALVGLGLNSFSNSPTTSVTMSSTANFSLDTALLGSGDLMVGLLDPTTFGPGFSTLHFQITREGVVVEDQMFASSAAAVTYFNDRVLNFGSLSTGVVGTLDLSFLMEVTSLDDGSRFGTTFLVSRLGTACGPGDFDCDGDVDGRDFLVWQRNPAVGNLSDWQANFGPLIAESVAVPEPGTLALLAGVLACSFVLRNTRDALRHIDSRRTLL
ncbi:MAG: PEP-CTERM sorting domain-containing protein, partial [Bythopirellula sp.]|nr:PEP-CTERM sorting domain-containing protein [Bythopirellula sp.]